MRKILSLSIVMFLAFSVFAGGSGESSANTSTSTTATAGAKIVRVAAANPQVALDPQRYTYSIVMKITDNITEALLLTTEEGIEPVLLTGMPEISEDQLTYSFELLPDVKFHNGDTLTSADVKFSFERLINTVTMASLLKEVVGYDEFAGGSADELAGFNIVDDTHFTITLKQPYAPFLSVLSTSYCAIISQRAAEECAASGGTWGMTTLVGTGPFKLDSYTTGVGVEISRFDDYHGGPSKLDGVSYRFIDDVNTQILEYQAGNVDYADVDPSIYPVYSSNPVLAAQMHSFQPVGCYSMSYNTRTYTDPRVREAFTLAIDRAAICESILHGTATVPNSYIPAGIIGHDDSLPLFEYNPERAKELLAEAGYPNGIDLRVTVNTAYQGNVAIATAFQQQAKAAGINVIVEQVDSAAWSDMRLNGGVDCGIANWYVDYADPESMLYTWTNTDSRSSFWHNAEFEQLLKDGIATTDTEERQAIYTRAEYILTREDFAGTPLYNETKFYLLNPAISGFEIDSTFRMFWKNADIER